MGQPFKSPILIFINKVAIEEVQRVKYLGVLIDSKLTFKYHIGELNRKVSGAIGVLYKLRPFVTFDIYKLELGKLVHQSVNVICPAHKVIKFNLASELHCHNTRLCYVSRVRTTRFGLKDLKIEGAKL